MVWGTAKASSASDDTVTISGVPHPMSVHPFVSASQPAAVNAATAEQTARSHRPIWLVPQLDPTITAVTVR